MTPLPRPMMQTSSAWPWISTGSSPSRRCVSMSPAFDASTLPSIASERVPVSRRTLTVAGGAFLVVLQRARAQDGFEIVGCRGTARTCRRRSPAARGPTAAATGSRDAAISDGRRPTTRDVRVGVASVRRSRSRSRRGAASSADTAAPPRTRRRCAAI